MFTLKENDFVRHSKLTLEQYLAFCDEAEKQGWENYDSSPVQKYKSNFENTRLFLGKLFGTRYFGTSTCSDGNNITQQFIDYLEEKNVKEFKVNGYTAPKDATYYGTGGTLTNVCWYKQIDGRWYYSYRDDGYWSKVFDNVPSEVPLTKIEREFTKSDLKDGMCVTYRSGDTRYVLREVLVEVIGKEVYTKACLYEFNDDLTNYFTKELDIVKVVDRDGTVLFERNESTKQETKVTIELTQEQAELVKKQLGIE